jgi:hypothetical protein
VNEQNQTMADLRGGESLKVTIRRCFDHRLMLQWYEILKISQTLQVIVEGDALM